MLSGSKTIVKRTAAAFRLGMSTYSTRKDARNEAHTRKFETDQIQKASPSLFSDDHVVGQGSSRYHV